MLYITSTTGGIVRELGYLAKTIWLWCKMRNVLLTDKHIPGADNSIADYESRNCKSNTEWTLQNDGFLNIATLFGMPDIDLFASRLNHKVDTYVSWKPDPGSHGIDAFSHSWKSFKLAYAIPPFSLVGKVVHKCIVDKAELLLIAPYWTTQYWFSLVMAHVVDEPLQLKCAD